MNHKRLAYIFCAIIVLAMVICAVLRAGDIKPAELKRLANIDQAPGWAQAMKEGGTLEVHGVWLNSISLGKLVYPDDKPLVLDMAGSLLYGFEGEPGDFDVMHPPARKGWGLTIMDCHNLVVKGLEVWGGPESAVNLNDSYPEIGIKNVRLESVTVRYASTRGIFLGGSNIDGVVLDRVVVRETMGGGATHGCYLSGGIWTPAWGPVKNVKVIDSTFCLIGGRHGLQINGRFEGVQILGCRFFFNQLSGLSLIGVRDCTVERCGFFGNNRSCLVIYNDFDESYWNPDDPASVAAWKSTHHPNGFLNFENNTFVVGPTQWMKDPWHNNDPAQFPCVQVNNEVHGKTFAGQVMDFPPGPIRFKGNIFLSQSGQIFKFSNPHDALAVHVDKNWLWGVKIQPYVTWPHQPYDYPISTAEAVAAHVYAGNATGDPKIPIAAYPLTALLSPDEPRDWSVYWTMGMQTTLRPRSFGARQYGKHALEMKAKAQE